MSAADSEFEKPPTVRERLDDLSAAYYGLCRLDGHRYMIPVIKYFKKIPRADRELLEFFDKCMADGDNAKENMFYQAEWPDTEEVTEDDKDEQVLAALKACEVESGDLEKLALAHLAAKNALESKCRSLFRS